MIFDGTDQPLRPIQKLTRPLVRFLHIESASGIVLLACTVIAVAAANSPLVTAYNRLWEVKLTLGLGRYALSYPLWYWVNDGLMTVFFFLVGMEIKRELTAGELKNPRRVIAPVIAAAGGAIVPAIIYLGFQFGEPGQHGWAIPMATDIAFVVGALTLLGRRVPHGLKIFLLTLAIADDIFAVLVIALFYSSQLKLLWVAAMASGIGMVILMNRLGVRTVVGYLLAGAVIWLCTLKSGIHPTISGVVLGLLTPATPLISRESLKATLGNVSNMLAMDPKQSGGAKSREILEEINFVSREAISPLERFEADVHPWAAFVIMPVFALVNAGVPFSVESITDPVSLAVALGLLIGKPLGIVLSLVLLVKLGLAILPGGVTWKAMVGAGCLAGIGFTMSLFVASLSLTGGLLIDAKSGVLLGSGISALLGFVILAFSLKPQNTRSIV
jgi:NhaA family Na+:H+ antiporter